MMTSSNGNIFCVTCFLCGKFTVTGGFPAQRQVTQSFDVFFDLRLNKRLSKNGDTGYLKSLLAPKHTSQHGGCWWHCPSLHWRHNERYGISNHHRLGCLLSHLFGRRSKKTPKVRVIGFVWGIYRWPVNSLHKGPVTRKMFPCDDVAMSLAHGQLQPSGWSIRFAQFHFHRITCCW